MCLSSATDLHLIPWSFILRLSHSTHSSPPAHFSIFSLINHQEHSYPLPPSSILPFLSISHKRAVCHPSVPFPLSVSHSSRLIHPFPPLHLHISPQISWFHHSIPLSFHQLWAPLSPHFLPSVGPGFGVLHPGSVFRVITRLVNSFMDSTLSVTHAGRSPARLQCNQLTCAHLTCMYKQQAT